MMNERQKMVTEAIWKTVVLCYQDPDDRSGNKVLVPIEEAVGALGTCIAQILVDVDSTRRRQEILTALAPMIDRAVLAARERSDLIVTPQNAIVVPN